MFKRKIYSKMQEWKRYLVYTKDMSKEQDIFCVPVYMVPFL